MSKILATYVELINSKNYKDINSSLSNSSLHIELGSQFNGTSLNAYLQLTSLQKPMIRSNTWTLNLSSGKLIGPVFSDHPMTYASTAQGLSSNMAEKLNSTEPVYSSSNWAGYQYYDSYVGVPTINPITAFSSNVKVVSFGEPPSGQEVTSVLYNGAYYSISRAGSAWIGLSQGSGGSGGLIQTGYGWSDIGGSLNIWYELLPGPQYLYPDQGTYPIHVGDILSLTLQQVSGAWDFEVYDYNNGHTYTASISSTEDAYYAQTIAEATTFQYSNGVQLVQQIPEFNTQINFEGANIYGAGPGGAYENIPTTSLYDSGWYTQSYLQQDSNYPNNINNAYVMETGTYYTNIYGYPQETWENSYYNLYGGQNSPPTSAADFYKQRRRWTYSIMDNRGTIQGLDRKAMLFILYRYAVGWTGVIGMTFWFADTILGARKSLFYTIGGVFNLAMSLIIYEYGVFNTNRRYAIWMALMLIPIAFYEGGTFIYMLLKPPYTCNVGEQEFVEGRIPDEFSISITDSEDHTVMKLVEKYGECKAESNERKKQVELDRGKFQDLHLEYGGKCSTVMALVKGSREEITEAYFREAGIHAKFFLGDERADALYDDIIVEGRGE